MKDFIIPEFAPGDDRDMGTPARSGAPVATTAGPEAAPSRAVMPCCAGCARG